MICVMLHVKFIDLIDKHSLLFARYALTLVFM